MIRSMTAYAFRSGSGNGQSWTWEMRGVNGRGLDLRMRLPDWIDGLEPRIGPVLRERLARGHVTLTLKVERETVRAEVDGDAIERALDRIAAVEARAAARGKVLAPCRANDVLAMVPSAAAASVDAGLADRLVAELETRVLPAFVEMRAQEGQALKSLMEGHLDAIGGLVAQAADKAGDREARLSAQIREAHARVMDTAGGLDPDRLVQELAIVAMKADVTEELDRLRVHVQAARALLSAGGPVGRKLDFLMQEFNREANTLASKSQDAALTSTALALKSGIERLREQVQNVE